MLSGRYFLYLVASLAYFLNLEKCYPYFALQSYDTVIFNCAFVACLLLLILAAGTFQMYRDSRGSTLVAL